MPACHVYSSLVQPCRVPLSLLTLFLFVFLQGPTKLHVNPIFEIGPCEPRFSEVCLQREQQRKRCLCPHSNATVSRLCIIACDEDEVLRPIMKAVY